jgi:hypothetical protein
LRANGRYKSSDEMTETAIRMTISDLSFMSSVGVI